MARRKKYVDQSPFRYQREPEYTLESGRKIERGEVIKIAGEHGSKFRFLEHVINLDNGAEWIDCFELRNGVASGWRSFRTDRIKPLPRKRMRKNESR